MLKAKVLVVGPCESGKTALSNFLAEATDSSGGDYHPTQGVRILEFETGNMGLGTAGRQSSVEVELWDCSGDKRFEACWPAFAKDATGVIFVYNADQKTHEDELENWFNYFVEQQGVKESSCIVFAHHKPGSSDRERAHLSASFNNIPCIQTNIDEGGEALQAEFNRYINKLSSAMSDKRDQEELSIMNQR